jgi:hypothetical protein
VVTGEKIEHVILAHEDLVLTADERAAILELAYLTIAWDGALAKSELDAFRILASHLRDMVGDPGIGPDSRRPAPAAENRRLTETELAKLLAQFASGLEREAADARILTLAPRLARREAAAFAYEIACALSLIDGDSGDAEFELELQLVDALDISTDAAENLALRTRTLMLG